MPSASSVSNRRFLLLLFLAAVFLTFTIFSLNTSDSEGAPLAHGKTPIHHVTVADSTLNGEAIMGKLGNETLKYVSDILQKQRE